jgi:hypothetical protein
MKQLENKIDKFKIWKEKFSNMKLISNILDLPRTKYTIQLKKKVVIGFGNLRENGK